jgi:hypothetical protein
MLYKASVPYWLSSIKVKDNRSLSQLKLNYRKKDQGGFMNKTTEVYHGM